jgi:hypothetical protein
MSTAMPKSELPMGTVAESIAIGRLIERDHVKANDEFRRRRIGLQGKLRGLRERGATAEEIEALAAELRQLPASKGAREHAAEVVGMHPAEYQRANEVTAAAERDPERYADLLPWMETRSVHTAYTEMRKRRGDEVKPRKSESHTRNALLRKGLRPQHNDMMDRAIRALDGAVMGLRLVDLQQLDRQRIAPWLASFAEVAHYLHRLHKEVLALYDKD